MVCRRAVTALANGPMSKLGRCCQCASRIDRVNLSAPCPSPAGLQGLGSPLETILREPMEAFPNSICAEPGG